MKRLATVALLLLGLAPAKAQTVTTIGALSKTACVPQGHAAGPYAAGTAVGLLIPFYNIFRGSGPNYGGRLMSVSLTSQTALSPAGFKLYQFWHPPYNTLGPNSQSPFVDKMVPVLDPRDAMFMTPPITMFAADTALGGTVYGQDNIGRAVMHYVPNDYWLIVTNSPVTFSSSNELTLCVTYQLD